MEPALPPSRTVSETDILAILDTHVYSPGVYYDASFRPPSCTCGEWEYESRSSGGHNQHIAAVLHRRLKPGRPLQTELCVAPEED